MRGHQELRAQIIPGKLNQKPKAPSGRSTKVYHAQRVRLTSITDQELSSSRTVLAAEKTSSRDLTWTTSTAHPQMNFLSMPLRSWSVLSSP